MTTLYDIAAFDELELGIPVQQLNFANAQLSAADLITGPAKIVQRFLLILLLEQGSQIYDPTAGCTFLVDLQAGRWRTVADVLQSFYTALLDVRRQLRAVETAADPANERYAGVTVLGVTLTGTIAAIRLLLATQDGSVQAFVAPVLLTTR